MLVYIFSNNLRPNNDDIEEFIVNLTYFDIIVRSMMLCDMNTGNMGFLRPFSEKGSNIRFYKPVVVDFDIVSIGVIGEKNREFFSKIESENREERIELFNLQQKQKKQEFKYAYFNIYESFLNDNSTTKYDSVLDGFFVPNLRPNITENEATFKEKRELFRKRKRAYGMLATRAIVENNAIGIIDKVFTNFKDKVLTQISDNALQCSQKEALSDLEDYKKSIEWNMDRLTRLLEINSKSDNWE